MSDPKQSSIFTRQPTVLAPPDSAVVAEPSLSLKAGIPGRAGRWQPTRAGVVNSWAWAEEVFLFADGWAALAGANGSGKSLTASMLWTLLLDGDHTQKALSVSGEAAGTLVSRHTDRNEREDRTGVWWIEYGLRSGETGATEYFTTGLWLRAVSGNLHRAFFTVPVRIGAELTLTRDRDPIGIDDLAQQVASREGNLFTDSQRLKGKAQEHFAGDRSNDLRAEGDYRDEIRDRLFAPLDEVQFDALIGVLRSLRSVRTSEGISPSQMCEVLTDALPALDHEQLTVIAEAMERISDLEEQLNRSREETRLLERTESIYRRYLKSTVDVESASLIAADNAVDEQTKYAREVEKRLESSDAIVKSAKAQLDVLGSEITDNEGALEGYENLLRDHAGAELPQMEVRLSELRAQATESAERAVKAQKLADQYAAITRDSQGSARTTQQHLMKLGEELGGPSALTSAGGALERMLEIGRKMTSAPLDQIQTGSRESDASQDLLATVEVTSIVATPLAWIDMRRSQVRVVGDALAKFSQAQTEQMLLAGQARDCEDRVDEVEKVELAATSARTGVEDDLRRRHRIWDQSRLELPPVPAQLLEPEDRVEPIQLTNWLQGVASTTAGRIALTEHRATAKTAAALAVAAQKTLDGARASLNDAVAKLATAVSNAVKARMDTEAGQAAVIHSRLTVEKTFGDAIQEADQLTFSALDALADGQIAAQRAATTWVVEATSWQEELVQLREQLQAGPLADTLQAILAVEPGAGLHASDVDPYMAANIVQRAHGLASTHLSGKIARADAEVLRTQNILERIRQQIKDARRAAPIPAPPQWRSERDPAAGSPLFELVDFAADLNEDDANRLEGALLVAGLLDAVITPDGTVLAGDLTLNPADQGASPASGIRRSLADVLVVEDHSSIAAQRVRAVLSAIPLDKPDARGLRHPDGPNLSQLEIGILTASAPAGYRAVYIGRTTRERSRRERLAELSEQESTANDVVTAALTVRACLDDDTAMADRERDRFPAGTAVFAARKEVDRLSVLLLGAEAQTARGHADANLVRQGAMAELDADDLRLRSELEHAEASLSRAESVHNAAEDRRERANQEYEQAAEEQVEAAGHLEMAQAAQNRADEELNSFPDLVGLTQAIVLEDRASADSARARANLATARSRVAAISEHVRTSLKGVNEAATQSDGTLLPTRIEALHRLEEGLNALAIGVAGWREVAGRVLDLVPRARTALVLEVGAQQEAKHAEVDAARKKSNADRLGMSIKIQRELHGSEYEDLLGKKEKLVKQLAALRISVLQAEQDNMQAAVDVAKAEAELDGLRPRRQEAESDRERRLARMKLLVTLDLAKVPEGIPVDGAGHPRSLRAALDWGKRQLIGQPTDHTRLPRLKSDRDRLLTQVEKGVRTANESLARYDQQLIVSTPEGTDWRQVTLAAPHAATGEDLRSALEALQATINRLESDLRDDVKRILKTSMFTQLRSDVQQRREIAQELVRQIHSTLAGVRTGVADVGVEVDWQVRDDPDARRMIELISAAPSDETFEQMYQVLRQRMDETIGEKWADRVAHAFDYRAWHEWKISVAHASFPDDGKGRGRFKPVTARSNPLKSLSTGESRLATMLPLLAAAWSMYSGPEYRGPRLLSIDEIDAAFDEPNLRQVLSLLRSWEFDVLSTTPSIPPLIKREAGSVVIHQVVTSGRKRVTVPWLWQGRGEPTPLTFDLLTLDGINGDGSTTTDLTLPLEGI